MAITTTKQYVSTFIVTTLTATRFGYISRHLQTVQNIIRSFGMQLQNLLTDLKKIYDKFIHENSIELFLVLPVNATRM